MDFFKLFSNFKKKSFGPSDDRFAQALRRQIGGYNGNSYSLLETYSKSMYVYTAVTRIAEAVSMVEMTLHKISNKEGDVERVYAHELIDLLHRPNAEQTKTELVQTLVVNYMLTGNMFLLIYDEGRQLLSVSPTRVSIIRNTKNHEIKNFQVTLDQGEFLTVEPENMIHIKSPNPLSNDMGIGAIHSAFSKIQTEEYGQGYQRDFFINQARPDAILKSKMNIQPDKKEEMRRNWNRRFKGLSNNNKIAILEGDVEYQQISISQREMDYINSMKAVRDDILVALGVPKSIIGITDDVNLANAQTAKYNFYAFTIKPKMQMIVEKINQRLVYPKYSNFYFSFVDPTPEDKELKLKQYESGLKFSYLLPNEVREELGREPIEGGWEVLGQTNEDIANAAEENAQKAKQKAFSGKGDVKKNFETIDKEVKRFKKKVKTEIKKKKLEQARSEERLAFNKQLNERIDESAEILKKPLTNYFSEQKQRLRREAQEIFKRKSIDDEIRDALQKFFTADSDALVDLLNSFLTTLALRAGNAAIIGDNGSFDFAQSTQQELQRRAQEFGFEINMTTRDKISDAIAEAIENEQGIPGIMQAIEGVYSGFDDGRLSLIARTEAGAAVNLATLDSYRQSNVVVGKEWIATNDGRTRTEHRELDGEIVSLDKNFSNGLRYPNEPNCRCTIGPVTDQ